MTATAQQLAILVLDLPLAVQDHVLAWAERLHKEFGFPEGDVRDQLADGMARVDAGNDVPLSADDRRSVKTALQVAHLAEELPVSVQQELLAEVRQI